jgi:hypothetical protein
MQEQATFQLEMRRGPYAGQVFELPRATVSIGRDPGNNVVIDDPQISRQHARITPQGGLLILEDLGSTNGTAVNGLPIEDVYVLANGDEIGLGENVSLVFRGRPGPASGDTMVAPRVTYADQPPAATYAHPSAPAYEEVAYPPYETYAGDYEEDPGPDYAAYDYDYEDYPEEGGRNWALIGMGCLLVAIIVVLLLAIYVYFFAPASIVDPIIDFLAGFGVKVP